MKIKVYLHRGKAMARGAFNKPHDARAFIDAVAPPWKRVMVDVNLKSGGKELHLFPTHREATRFMDAVYSSHHGTGASPTKGVSYHNKVRDVNSYTL